MVVKLGFGDPIPPETKQYNILPAGLHWIRHIDCSFHLIPKDELMEEKF
jgi:hypothetical protein